MLYSGTVRERFFLEIYPLSKVTEGILHLFVPGRRIARATGYDMVFSYVKG